MTLYPQQQVNILFDDGRTKQSAMVIREGDSKNTWVVCRYMATEDVFWLNT